MVERRLTWLVRIVLLWGAAIFLKLVSLQVLHHQEYAKKARMRQELVVPLPGPRGTIYDRSGQPLAMSVPTVSVYINPLKVPDLEVASDLLARALHIDRTPLDDAMKLAYENKRGFLWVKRRIEPDEAKCLLDMHREWIFLEQEPQRHYPKGTLAAHVLGSVDFEETGNAGIEKSLDGDLRGEDGQMRMLTDVKRRGIESQLDAEAHPGAPITLTIDERLQFVAEREIAAAVEAHHAVSGSVVVMVPTTGELLAVASYPTYDPNLPPQPSENFARQNHAVSVPFEPGSCFKVITLSAALETTHLTPESLINCHGGVLALPGRVVHDSHAGLGIIPMAMVLAKSSNIGAIEVGMRVGQQNMMEYMRRFGFGQKTGIELPAESGGKVRKRWGTTSLASVSMGQEVSVTTLQLAQATSIIANGGYLVRPRLVLQKGGQTLPAGRQGTPKVRVLKPDTVITMRNMMEGVVLHGTGTAARLEGYSVGGKTGSAQIFDFASKHYTHTYNGSFLGFAPLTNPAIVVVVSLNGTHGNAGFGGAAAAPVFHTVAAEALRILEVPKDIPDEPVLVAAKQDTDDLAISEGDPDEPNILQDSDEDGEPAAPPAPIVGPLVPAPRNGEPEAAGPKVPDFRGMSMREVLAEATARGLTVQPDGSGVARVQKPPAGAILRQGEIIRVQFAR
ncbi:MAG TPA: penicillin-binding protein [Bryobacteraceae bacterium]|nr:penicillin-binding protein [Bryobacteraceae bacterium]